jgi:hypothetical protein
LHHATLWLGHDTFLPHPSLEPFVDQAEYAPVSYPVFQKAEEPRVAHALEERGQICIEDPLDLGAGNPERQGIKRIMLPATRPEAITEAEEVALVNLIQYGDHGPLDDFIFQRRNPEGPLAPIRLRDVLPADGVSTIRLAVDPVMEVVETLLQVLPIFLPGLPVDPWSGITLEREVCLPQTVHIEVVEQGGHPLCFLSAGCLPYTPQPLGHARPALRPVRAAL